jgi:hypothetical protein
MKDSHNGRKQGKHRGRNERHAPESTGSHSEYLRGLIDSETEVTIVMSDGETLKGRIRYYDRDCLSIGLSATGLNVFLRKDQILYLADS